MWCHPFQISGKFIYLSILYETLKTEYETWEMNCPTFNRGVFRSRSSCSTSCTKRCPFVRRLRRQTPQLTPSPLTPAPPPPSVARRSAVWCGARGCYVSAAAASKRSCAAWSPKSAEASAPKGRCSLWIPSRLQHCAICYWLMMSQGTWMYCSPLHYYLKWWYARIL